MSPNSLRTTIRLPRSTLRSCSLTRAHSLAIPRVAGITNPINASAASTALSLANIPLLQVSLSQSSNQKVSGLLAGHFSEQLDLFLISQGQILDGNRISWLVAGDSSRSSYVAVNFRKCRVKLRKQPGRNDG